MPLSVFVDDDGDDATIKHMISSNELKNIFNRNQFNWDPKWLVYMFYKHFYECLCWEKIMALLTTFNIFITPIYLPSSLAQNFFISHAGLFIHISLVYYLCSMLYWEHRKLCHCNKGECVRFCVFLFFLWFHQKHTTFIFVQQKNIRVGMCFENGTTNTLCTWRRLKV